jgi:Uncharacterised nucleotidyltransferase
MPHSVTSRTPPPASTSGGSSDHKPEIELLLQTSRMVVSSSGEARIHNLLRQEIDWGFLIQSAHYHRVLPLLYHTLTRVSPGFVPEYAMATLRKRFQANTQHSLFLCAELIQVLDLFDRHQVRAIPYKGPMLAAALYGDVSLRQFGDLDIIVPASKVEEARGLLISRGYKPEKEITGGELRRAIQHGKDLILRRDGGITVELHWGITAHPDPIDFSTDLLWKNLKTLSIAGRAVTMHAPEDLLLILCIHGGKHRWEYLVWLCDIAELIRCYPTLNWTHVIEDASSVGGKRILLLGVLLSRELLGAELPENLNRIMEADRVLIQLADQVKAWLTKETHVAAEPGEMPRYYLKLRENRADRLRVALTQAKHYLALTSRDREVLPGSAPLQYLGRPFRLAWEYGLRPFQRFLKGIGESWRG